VEGHATFPIDLSVGEFFTHVGLACLCVARRQVNEADDAPFESPQGGEHVEPHHSLAFRTNKRVCFINLTRPFCSPLG